MTEKRTRIALIAFSIISALYFIGIATALYVEFVPGGRYIDYEILGWIHLFAGAVLVFILLILWFVWLYGFNGEGYRSKTKTQIRNIMTMICYFAFYYIVTTILIWRWPRESDVNKADDLSSNNGEDSLHLQLIQAAMAIVAVPLIWLSALGIGSLITTGRNNTNALK